MFLTEFPSFHSIEKDIQDFNTIMNNYIINSITIIVCNFHIIN